MHRIAYHHAALFLAVLLVAGCAKSPRSLVAVSSDAPSTETLLRLATVYPLTFITSPRPTHQQPVAVPPSFTVQWTGVDPRAENGLPTGYLTRVVSWSDIDPASPGGATQLQVRAFFQADYANNRDAWTATTANDQALADQPVQEVRYFAIVGQYAPGETDSVDMQFSLDQNVLTYRATREFIGPRITVSNRFFNFTKTFASLDPAPSRSIAVPAGEPVTMRSQAQPAVGRILDGFRWALDISSVEDETPRRNEKDLAHWSAWTPGTSDGQHEDVIGPFPPGDAKKPPHRYFIEVRDNLGGINLVVIEIAVQARLRPPGQLLLVDDMYGTTTERLPDGTFNYKAPYPMEAEQDSFYNAVGGFPDSITLLGRPQRGDPGALSLAGAFAGFDYDTLDYRFWPTEDIEVLQQYRAVAWYSDPASAARSGGKFSTTPSTLLRAINSAQRANTLAAYVAGGGKLWLFGEGATTAIANGFWSRIGGGAARLPYTSGEDPRSDILRPGNFLYDFVHLRSELVTAGIAVNPTATADQRLHGAIPYLPQYAGPASQEDRSHDPRIGPSAARTAERWFDLPPLTIANYRTANVDPGLRSLGLTWVISKPLSITEGEGRNAVPTVDTLYLCQAVAFDPLHEKVPPSDGFPNAIDYHGSDNGEVVWFGFSLYFFELDQARQVVRSVMRNFGIDPLPPGVRQGPGAAEPPAGTNPVPLVQSMR